MGPNWVPRMSAVQPRFRLCRVLLVALGTGWNGRLTSPNPLDSRHFASPGAIANSALFATIVQQLSACTGGGDAWRQAMALTRAARRETLRAALRLWTMPFCAVRTRTG